MNKNLVEVGDWFKVRYTYSDYLQVPHFIKVCVIEVHADGIMVKNPKWWGFNPVFISWGTLYNSEYMGKGKPRTWWKYLPKFLQKHILPTSLPDTF